MQRPARGARAELVETKGHSSAEWPFVFMAWWVMAFSFLTNREDFHEARPAFGVLAEALRELELPRKRRHQLLILSCYMNPEAVEQLVDLVASHVRLTECQVLFDYSEVLTQGPSRLDGKFRGLGRRFKQRHSELSFEWSPVRPKSGSLVHAKAYAIVQADKKHRTAGGIVLTGSANATMRGLGLAEPSNVELGYLTTRYADVKGFQAMFAKIAMHNAVSVKELVSSDQKELFRYALLSQGRFFVKWSGNLRAFLSVRYPLSKRGKKEVSFSDRSLQDRDLVGDQSGFTKGYLKIPAGARRRNFPRNFSRDYTLETRLGRWCPSSVWRIVEQEKRNDDEAFFGAIRQCLSEPSLEKAKALAKGDLDYLNGRGWVDCDQDHLERWKKKLVDLRDHPDRLCRVRDLFSDFQLPYGREDVEQVDDIFASLEESLRFAKRRNIAMDKVDAALRGQSLAALELDAAQKKALRKLFRA